MTVRQGALRRQLRRAQVHHHRYAKHGGADRLSRARFDCFTPRQQVLLLRGLPAVMPGPRPIVECSAIPLPVMLLSQLLRGWCAHDAGVC
jgi:hypothetical protein